MSLVKSTVAAVLLAITASAIPSAYAQSPQDLQTMQSFLNIVESYYSMIDSTHDIASDEEKAAILQMQKIQEVYEQRGQKAEAVIVFREVLKESRNPTIRNAAFVMIADNLKDVGRTDEALEILREGLKENISAAQ